MSQLQLVNWSKTGSLSFVETARSAGDGRGRVISRGNICVFCLLSETRAELACCHLLWRSCSCRSVRRQVEHRLSEYRQSELMRRHGFLGILAYAIGKMDGVSGLRGWAWYVCSLCFDDDIYFVIGSLSWRVSSPWPFPSSLTSSFQPGPIKLNLLVTSSVVEPFIAEVLSPLISPPRVADAGGKSSPSPTLGRRLGRSPHREVPVEICQAGSARSSGLGLCCALSWLCFRSVFIKSVHGMESWLNLNQSQVDRAIAILQPTIIASLGYASWQAQL